MPATTLAAAITNTTDTTCTVRDVVDFTARADSTYRVWVDTEQMLVAGGTGTTSWSSITRGYGGTTKATHLSGATVWLIEEAYASLADFLALSDNPPPASKYTAITNALADAARGLDDAIDWNFLLHAAGEVVVLDAADSWNLSPDRSRLCLHRDGFGGWASITKVEVSLDYGTTWVEIVSGDYILLPRQLATSEPYDHLQLSVGSANYTTFPVGESAVRLTGQPGYASIPATIRRANLMWARQIFRGDAPGPEEFAGGQPIGFWPKEVKLALDHYRGKFRCGS